MKKSFDGRVSQDDSLGKSEKLSFISLIDCCATRYQRNILLNQKAGKARSSHPEACLQKVPLKIYNKFTGEHPCQRAISINLQSNFNEITFWHGCSPVNLLYIFSKSVKNWGKTLKLKL